MYLPPEILIEILNPHRGNLKLLATLRLVNKNFNDIISSFFFGPLNIRLRYGLEHSIPQMRTLIGNPVLLQHINALFIPSESFFLADKEFQLCEKCTFPWSRLKREEDGHPIVEYQNDSSRQFHKDPTDPSVQFSPLVQNLENDYTEYVDALSDLLVACENLEVVEIAMGLNRDTNRMQCWASMFPRKLFPILSKTSVKALRIMIPHAQNIDMLLRQRIFDNNQVAAETLLFPNLGSVAIMINTAEGYELDYLSKNLKKPLKYFFQDSPLKIVDIRHIHEKAIWDSFRMEQLDWGTRYFLASRSKAPAGVNDIGVKSKARYKLNETSSDSGATSTEWSSED